MSNRVGCGEVGVCRASRGTICHGCHSEILKGQYWTRSGLRPYHLTCLKIATGELMFELPVKPARLESVTA